MRARFDYDEVQPRFCELPLRVFASRYPDIYWNFLAAVFDINDFRYVVRFNGSDVEVGYPEDVWIKFDV